MEHQLYKTGDENCPQSILDRNGEVVLNLCKLCGKAESELEQYCVASPRIRARLILSDFKSHNDSVKAIDAILALAVDLMWEKKVKEAEGLEM